MKCKSSLSLSLFFATGMQMNTHHKPIALFVSVARPLSVKSHRSLMLSNLRVPMDSMGRFHGCVCFFFPRRTLLHVYWRTKCHGPTRSGIQSGGHLQVGDALAAKPELGAVCPGAPCGQGWSCSVCLGRAERQQNKGCQKSAFFVVYFKRESGLDKESNCRHLFWIPCSCIWDWVRQGIAVICVTAVFSNFLFFKQYYYWVN